MHYLLTNSEMAECDRYTIEDLGVAALELMENAGAEVADLCAELCQSGRSVVIICGKGNNGGDGFVAARLLAERGLEVECFVTCERDSIAGHAREVMEALVSLRPDVRVSEIHGQEGLEALRRSLAGADIAVDAILGTGLNAEVEEPILGVINLLNGYPGLVVAVDVPSGVSGDTGQVYGTAVQADHTVSFAFPKRGHFLYPGAEQVGELHVVDIGIPRSLAHERDIRAGLLTELDGVEMIPSRALFSHKGSFGHLAVWAGSRETPGAGILTLRGGLRAGAGLVSWAVDEQTLDFSPDFPPEVMLKVATFRESVRTWTERTLERATAVVAGPGLGRSGEIFDHLYDLLELCEVPMCLDAEALNLMAERPELWKLIQAPVVITPHPKEMARLVGTTVAGVQEDRIGVASRFATDMECVVVLKGAHTVVASPDGFSVVIGAGNPGMATGGSGDVLAGVIGALLAAGLEPERAACGGALLHAVAGDTAAERLGQTALIATDIIDALGPVLHSWGR